MASLFLFLNLIVYLAGWCVHNNHSEDDKAKVRIVCLLRLIYSYLMQVIS
ncbi:hypothetical protein Syun_029371 [Stephania yunnanensis]|uniref:Uncharacterized protein n=1 Tax=Stephania yunnanensis TaxID=152371 RepID=A0AAP0E8V3_9MAGN